VSDRVSTEPAPAFHLLQVEPRCAEALALLDEAVAEANVLYPELHSPGRPPPSNEPLPERAVFLLATTGTQQAGCAALYPLDATTAEVKRVYVSRPFRQRGVARMMMAELVRLARAFGYRRLWLETGYRQIPAIQLYVSLGFTRIPPFGRYIGDPTSVCFGLELEAWPS
jgi:GNAT superfamily N-acetyltransferase